MAANGPQVLILGGVGFVGRNLVKYLVDRKVASKICVVDKVLPQTAYLSKEHQAALDNPIVEYKQGNLSNAASIEKCFDNNGRSYDVVFHLAAETKLSQTEEVYKEKVLDVCVKCATEAAKRSVAKFVFVSTALVYEEGSKPSTEDSKLKPWTLQAKYMLQAEEALRKISGLNLVIVRPVFIYGPGDTRGLAPRVITAAVYKKLDKKMKFLWSGSLLMNTVHVHDVCAALWLLWEKAPVGSVWNLADKNATDQEKINKHLEAIFGIRTDFAGTLLSNAAKLSMSSVCEDVNDKHLTPWAEMCKEQKIVNTPLTPYLDQELLYNTALSVDGSKIESLGFKYEYPTVQTEEVRRIISYFATEQASGQQLFPVI